MRDILTPWTETFIVTTNTEKTRCTVRLNIKCPSIPLQLPEKKSRKNTVRSSLCIKKIRKKIRKKRKGKKKGGRSDRIVDQFGTSVTNSTFQLVIESPN